MIADRLKPRKPGNAYSLNSVAQCSTHFSLQIFPPLTKTLLSFNFLSHSFLTNFPSASLLNLFDTTVYLSPFFFLFLFPFEISLLWFGVSSDFRSCSADELRWVLFGTAIMKLGRWRRVRLSIVAIPSPLILRFQPLRYLVIFLQVFLFYGNYCLVHQQESYFCWINHPQNLNIC